LAGASTRVFGLVQTSVQAVGPDAGQGALCILAVTDARSPTAACDHCNESALMLGIGALGATSAAYYLDTVASGREDYYLDSGEAPGVWLGAHARTLGLEGTVAGPDLHAVLEGLDPASGLRLDRARTNRAPGFDLTFSAPKSVSITHALAGPDMRLQMRDAHDHAVAAALGWLERNACVVRRGAGGIRTAAGDGFVAAGFRHRTSRAGDPHLHTHVLVANLTRGPECHWSALDARHLYALSKTAGHLYEAQLRHNLTVALGVEWTEVRNGIADLAGIPRPLIENLSQRRHQILDRLDELGWRSARAAQVATLDTRTTKDPSVDVDALHVDWQSIAADFGIDTAALQDLIGQVDATPTPPAQLGVIEAAMFGPDGLTAHASTFDRRHVIQAWCNEMPAGASIADIERLTAHTLVAPPIAELSGERAGVTMRRADRRRMESPNLGARYSTHDLLALERRLLTESMNRATEGVGTVDHDTLVAALRAHPHLSKEQHRMVGALTTTGRGVDVVIAPAGAGKTTGLAAARDAWTRAGYHVFGCAVAARAAHQLENGAGIPSFTIAALRPELAGSQTFRRNTVLVVDEAGMAGTRTLAPLLDAARASGIKIVIVGDPKQLPEIDAGGLLRGLDHRIGGIDLHQNRRQQHAWERDALTHLREGRADEAIPAYELHGRLNSEPTANQTRARVARDFATAHQRSERVLMLAMRWRDIHELNRRARAILVDAGLVDGPTLEIDGSPYQRGDRVMTLRNARRHGITNGTTGTVEGVDPNAGTLTVRTDDGPTITLPATYLHHTTVVHAYATTVHKAQGITVDRAFIYADDRLARESAYTAMSRGAAENHIYLAHAHAAEPDHGHHQTSDARQELIRNLERSQAQHLATDHDLDVEIEL
jgi:conjugative relaxase-like TrwC/TraI family protein